MYHRLAIALSQNIKLWQNVRFLAAHELIYRLFHSEKLKSKPEAKHSEALIPYLIYGNLTPQSYLRWRLKYRDFLLFPLIVF